MNRTFNLCLAVALMGSGSATRAVSAETPGEQIPSDSTATQNGPLAWSAAYASWYSFQGLDYSHGFPVLQPEVTASLHGVSLGLWGNLDQARRELNEVDATLQVEREVGRVTGAFGYAHLRYPHRDWEATHELIANLGVAGPVQASLNMHWDVGAGRGRYWTLDLSREVPLRAATASLGAKLYLHQHYYDLSGFPALETSIGVSAPWAGVLLEPSLSRIWGWENGDFRGDQAIGSRWFMSLTCSPL